MLTTRRPKVAILDSGAGGLSIAKEITDQQLFTDIIYIADQSYFPYGKQSDNQLIHRLDYLVEKVQNIYQPDIFIIACNTASTLVLPHLRKRWDNDFIGVVPAIKPAAKSTATKSIVILSTEATSQRDYLFDLISDHAANIKVTCYGTQELVSIAEEFIESGFIDEGRLKKELEEALQGTESTDRMVLACTHFPIIKQHIETLLSPKGITTVDSTTAIVNRLISLLPEVHVSSSELKSSTLLMKHPIQHVFINTAEKILNNYSKFVFGDNPNRVQFLTNF